MLAWFKDRVYLLLISIALASIFMSYAHGVHRKFDARVTYGFEYDAWSMAVAISRLQFGLHEGYIGYHKIVEVMQSVLSPDGVNTESSIPLLSSKQKIQEALDAAAAVDPKMLPQYNGMGGDFNSIYYEDIGSSDLYTIGFALFGFTATAAYKAFYVIFGFSMLLFIWEYRKSILPLATLAIACATFPALIYSDLLITEHMPSVSANRFLSTLGFIPILHVFWSLRWKERLTRGQWERLVLQGFLFAFAVSCRKSVQWMLFWFIITMLIAAWPVWKGHAKRFSWEALKGVLREYKLRGGLVFLAAFITYKAVQTAMLNPIYFTDCAIPHHTTWHSVMVGTSMHPAWEQYNDFAPKGVAGSDTVAWGAYAMYKDKRGEPWTCAENGGRHRVGEHERVMRSLILDFFARHPRFAASLYLHHKPMWLWDSMKAIVQTPPAGFWTWARIIGMVVGISAYVMCRKEKLIPALTKITGIFCLGMLTSALPSMMAYANPRMADVMWMITIGYGLIVCAATVAVCCALERLSFKPSKKEKTV